MTDIDLDRIRGPVLVVAPHPDDESIGCGGLIACLRRSDIFVAVVIMTDGTGSHPNSLRYPAPQLAALREAEAREALSILNVDPHAVSFWRLTDRHVPTEGADFDRAVTRARTELRAWEPALLIIPGRTDAHGDHRATWTIWTQAIEAAAQPPRLLEYLVWPGPERPEGEMVTLNIADVLPLKRSAVAAHRSQHGLVVDDDPTGFTLPADLLARTRQSVEAYFEAVP